MFRKISYRFQILFMFLYFCLLLLGIGIASLFFGNGWDETFTIFLVLGACFPFVAVFMILKFLGGVK